MRVRVVRIENRRVREGVGADAGEEGRVRGREVRMRMGAGVRLGGEVVRVGLRVWM